MKRIALNDDIHSLSEFRSNASGFIEQIHNTKRPLVITQNGKSSAVVLDVNEYEKMMEEIELIQDIKIGTEQIAKGNGITHKNAYQRLKLRYSK